MHLGEHQAAVDAAAAVSACVARVPLYRMVGVSTLDGDTHAACVDVRYGRVAELKADLERRLGVPEQLQELLQAQQAQQAQQTHIAAAPKYTSQADCEADFGAEKCELAPQRTTSGGSVFMPLMAGYMMGSMLSGGGRGLHARRPERAEDGDVVAEPDVQRLHEAEHDHHPYGLPYGLPYWSPLWSPL